MTGQTRQILNRAERADWLRLIRSGNVGPITFFHLLRYYGSAAAALDALPALAARGGKRKITICPRDVAERELARIEEIGAALVAHGEPDYPRTLGAIEDAPPLIARLGHGQLLERPLVAIVGARNASSNGRRLATQLAADLGAAGITVVSGLARGIDTAAHKGALASGTAAVVAGGIDVVYPAENHRRSTRTSSRAAWCWPNRRRAPSRWRGTFRAATGSSPGSRSAWWWSRRRCARAR